MNEGNLPLLDEPTTVFDADTLRALAVTRFAGLPNSSLRHVKTSQKDLKSEMSHESGVLFY